MREDVVELIKALALKNAVDYGGKASAKAVIGRLAALRPDLRPKLRELAKLAADVIEEVNSLTLEAQKAELSNLAHLLPSEAPKREEAKRLPPLPGAEPGKVVTRFAPNPDFVLHLGSARPAILSHEYARMYDGKFILRFEDTDPRMKRAELEYYELIKEDLRWLGCDWDEEIVQSDRLELYYEVAEELMRKGAAYVCTCDKDTFHSYVLRKLSCPCRDRDDHMERWEKMLDGTFGEGEAVVRIKTDLSHPNPAVRDWPALRIIDTKKYPHPRVGSKYRVWPLYNFACAVDDHHTGVTHILRGAEHYTNEVKQRFLYAHMGWEYPVAVHHGRLMLAKGVLSKSKMLKGIREGSFAGYDDPRLATIRSLRRRGFPPEAIRRLVIEVGVKRSNAVVAMKNLAAYAKSIVDPVARRRFVVLEPVEMVVWGVREDTEARLPLHPSKPMGERAIPVRSDGEAVRVYVDRRDAASLKLGSAVRLMGLLNAVVEAVDEAVEARLHSWTPREGRELGAAFIHWAPTDGPAVEVLMPDASVKRGVGEPGLLDEEVDAVIQMERVGFSRVEEVDRKVRAVKLVFGFA